MIDILEETAAAYSHSLGLRAFVCRLAFCCIPGQSVACTTTIFDIVPSRLCHPFYSFP